MKDVTTTSFGLIIAYLLPGIIGLYGLKYFFSDIQTLFDAFLSAESNVGLFFWATLLALIAGIIVTPFRWLFYEGYLCKANRLTPDDLSAIGKSENMLLAWRAAIDENYRYHQCWGSITLVAPLCLIGWIYKHLSSIGIIKILIIVGCFIGFEYVIGKAAIEAFNRFVERTRAIMGGE